LAEERTQLPGSYESLYQRAQNFFRAGDLDAGLEILQRILKRLGTLSEETLRRHDDMARFGLSVGLETAAILSSSGRHDESIQVLESLARFDPENADALERQVAVVLVAKGDLDAALAKASSLVERFPYDPIHWLTVAEVATSRQDYDEASAALDKALELSTEPSHQGLIYHRRFILERAQGHTEEALAAWDQMAQLRPELAQRTMRQLYTYLLDIGDLERLRRYLQKDTSSSRAEYYRGVIDNREGDFAAGTARWRKLLERSPMEDPVGALEWAEAALRMGRTEDALAVLMAAEAAIRSPHTNLLVAIGLVRNGDVEAARRVLSNGVQLLNTEIPRQDRYSRADWEMFVSLTDNREAQDALKEYFEAEGTEAQ
jgi:tetratricopeptide (TPR) repeat protein